MDRPPTRISGVDYKAPGSDEWQSSDEVRRDLRRQARALLARADVEVRLAGRRHRRKAGDLLAFERDMAAALGAWDRWVEAGAKQLLRRSQDAAEDAAHEAWERVKRAFKIRDDE